MTSLIARLRPWLLSPSVRFKIMGIVLGLVLLLGFGVTWRVRASMTANLTTQLEERGISIARDLAARSTDYILINNTFALHDLLNDSIQNNTDLRYAFLLEPDGRLLVHSFDAGFPRGLAERNNVAPNERANKLVLSSDEGPIHDIAVPIFNGRAGTVRVGLTEQNLRAAVDSLTQQMLLTTLGVSLLGLGAAYLLTLILTRPILSLVDATQAVARGDLSRRVPPWGGDEIGQLSIAFNRMTSELDTTQRAILRRNRELAALNAVANVVNTTAPLVQALDHSLKTLLHTLDLPAGWIFLLDRASTQIQLTTWIGLPWEIGEREIERALQGCPCTVAPIEKKSSVVQPLPDCCPLRDGRLADSRVIASHMTVPILARDQVLGVLGVASAVALAFDADEVKLLNAVGQQLGVVIENARLWDDLREKERIRGQLLEKVIGAQEEERKRIARELHDDTGQAITSLMVGLRAVSDACDPSTRVRFEPLRDIAAQALDSVKRLARELRPALLDDLGLVAALERYVASYRANFGLNADLQVTGFHNGDRLASRQELALYRIVQEALTNIAKHAGARNVSVVVERKSKSVVAIIEDDGHGFDARAVLESPQQDSRLGLYGMRERAELLGGHLQIESESERGSSVFVEIPLT